MLHSIPRSKGNERQGAAAVELAVLLPLLMFLFLITIDYSRIYYFSIIVSNCARNGAIFGSDPYLASRTTTPYTDVQSAALADAKDLSPQPTVQTTYGSDYVEVSVTYPFTTLTNYPGLPKQVDVKRTVRMQIAPITPRL